MYIYIYINNYIINRCLHHSDFHLATIAGEVAASYGQGEQSTSPNTSSE